MTVGSEVQEKKEFWHFFEESGTVAEPNCVESVSLLKGKKNKGDTALGHSAWSILARYKRHGVGNQQQ